MEENPDKIEEKPQLQLGQTDRDIVLEFRKVCKDRKLLQVEVFKILLNWWLAKDYNEQQFLYHLPNETLREYFAAGPLDPTQESLLEIRGQVQQLLRRSKAAQAAIDDENAAAAACKAPKRTRHKRTNLKSG